MSQVIALALKDLRLMLRSHAAVFFTVVWPVLVTILFGMAFRGPGGGGTGKPSVALVDEDFTDGSRDFARRLEQSFEIAPMTRADAENAVRRGSKSAYVVLRPGFGEASQRLFYGNPREVEIGIDPSRKAESAMVEGLLVKTAAADMQRMLSDPAASSRMVDQALAAIGDPADAETGSVVRFLRELKTFVANPPSREGTQQMPAWEPVKVIAKDVARHWDGPRNSFEVTFPQGVIWGLIGCVMSFGISIVSERTHGTLVRLRMAPLTRAQILGGKALACFVSILVVQGVLFALALAVGVRPTSLLVLAMAGLSSAICFVGFMMLIASLGRTEQAASGAAWSIMMPLAMLGGAMIPQFFMPKWMQTIGIVSPVRWAVMAIEGGVWRQFTPAEVAMPCLILISIGLICFALGTRGLRDA